MVNGNKMPPRSRIVIILSAVSILAVAALWAALVILRPLPPRTVTMATGPEGGAYYEIGVRYKELFAQEGINLILLKTAGSMENLALLEDPKSDVQVGLLQGGITNKKKSPDLESLGTLFYEPLWLFYRSEIREKGKGAFLGRKISIGPEQSGTRVMARELFARNGINEHTAQLLALTPREAGETLLRGEIDAAALLASWDSPVVRQLLASSDIEVVSLPRTDAYVALYPFLSKVILPAGVADLIKNRPPVDTTLLATKASLIAHKDLHPALQYLLLDCAEQIHSGPGIFNKEGQFPAAESIDLPLSDEARQFYKSGRPFLQRYFPFWVAALMDRLLILLIPLLGIIYPLAQVLPGLYDSVMRRRIYRLYGELRLIEDRLDKHPETEDRISLFKQLDRLEGEANRLHVPQSYANLLYTLRDHVALVRNRLTRNDTTAEK